MGQIIQLKIRLTNTKPPIWRRVLVKKETSFYELHHIIQIVMGWQNYHLYEFKGKGYRIGVPNEELDELYDHKIIDATTVSLEEFISEPKEKLKYEYDFGDGWMHQINVEKILEKQSGVSYPICIAGKLNCPLEDCGGIWGFYQMLEILEDKKHPEREEMIEWVGENYDPEYFDTNQTNAILKNLDLYIREWEEQE